MAGGTDLILGGFRHDAQGRRIIRSVTEDTALAGEVIRVGATVRGADGTEEIVFEGIDAASFTGAIDFADELDEFATKRDLHIQPTDGKAVSNGSNGVRGDSIASDAANQGGAGGATFVAPDFITVQGDDRGSYHGYTAVVVLTEIDGEPDVYCEGGALLGQVWGSRKGAYMAGAEVGVLVNEGFPARANGISCGVNEFNDFADYATSGMSAQWQETGARGIWLWNAGGVGDLKVPGTGIFMEGNWARAAIYTQLGDQSTLILKNRQFGADDDFFSINGLGHIHWGLADGSSVVELAHNGVGGLLLTGELTVSGALQASDVLNVIADATFAADANVAGTVNANALGVGTNALIVGDLTVGDDLGVTGDASIGGTATATALAAGNTTISGALQHTGTTLKFYNGTGGVKPTITGSTAANVALKDLITKLETLGLLTDGTSP